MPQGGQQKCAKCGGTGHLALTCTSTTELRNKCICDEEEDLEWCGKHISKTDWNKGNRIHRECKHFLAGAASLVALVGTRFGGTPGRPKLIKAPKKTRSGTNESLYRDRDENEKEGRARREGNSGPSGTKVSSEAALKEKMTAADLEAIMAAPLKPVRDKQGRWRIPRAGAIVRRIDLASPIAPRLKFRPPNKAGRSAREQNGDPTIRSGQPTLATVRSIDSLVWLCKMSRDGLPIQIWDVEGKFVDAVWRDIRDKRGVAAADVFYCWESAISKAPCRPCAEISRVAYAVANTSKLTFEKKRDARTGESYTAVSGSAAVSEAEQKAVLDERDPRLPLGFQLGPEARMGPFLRKDIWLWDMYAALCRAAGHENGGDHNELIYLPLNSGALAFFFGLKFKHRAEPDTIDEIKFCQALGFEIYQLLKEDPNSRVDEIIDERFPGTDPTKWDFSSFKRSADAAPSKKRKRARKPLGEQNESEGEGGWDSDEHVSDSD